MTTVLLVNLAVNPVDPNTLAERGAGVQPRYSLAELTLRAPLLSAGATESASAPAQPNQLKGHEPPTSPGVALLASLVPTLIGTGMLAGGLYRANQQWRDPIVPLGIAGLGLGFLMFGPSGGDLLNDDVVRFTVHGLIRVGLVVATLALWALALGSGNDAPVVEVYAATALSVGGFAFAIYDVVSSHRAPERWRERNLPPVRAARLAWSF